MLSAVWTHKNKPELIDLPFNRTKTYDELEKLKEEVRSKSYRETCFA